MIRLTDEEIERAVDRGTHSSTSDEAEEIAKAQLKKVVEWVIELNDTEEEEDNSPGAYYVISKNLWQALLEEVKDK